MATPAAQVADNFAWREDSSGSEEPDAPHYPLDLRLAEARLQLEERLAQEARERRFEERQAERQAERRLAEELRARGSHNDVRKSPEDRRKADPVHFVLGGDNVNWTGEELTRAAHSQSQPQLRASLRAGAGGGAPLPPPRRPCAGAMVRSRSSDVVAAADEPRALLKQAATRQKALAEGTEQSETQSSNTPPEEESTDSSLMEDEGVPKPRRRRIQLPFGKKAKTPA